MLSGHGGEAEVQSCLHLGAYAYLKKPVPLESLLETIQVALRRQGPET